MIWFKERFEKIRQWRLPEITGLLKGVENVTPYFYLLLGLSVVVLSANLGEPPLWGSEGRWAVIARSMLRTGDLLSPALGIEYYWDKPLLSYWQVLPFASIKGGVDEFVVRFPSVVWAVVMLLLTYDLAKRWYSGQTALASVGILATTYGFIFWGRNAQVEMTNAAMILLCLWYFVKHRYDQRYPWVYGLGVMMGLGANMKGIVLYAVPICCFVIFSVVKKEWSWIPPVKVLIKTGLISFAVFLAVPTVTCIHSATWEPLQMVWRENVLRYFGLHDHQSPFYMYFIHIFSLGAPWAFLLPAALIHSLQVARRRDWQIQEALILFCAIFIFFTLSGARRSYYLLPILPFSAILVGNMLGEFRADALGRWIRGSIRGLGFLLGLAMIVPFVASLMFRQVLPLDTGVLWIVSGALALLGGAMIASVTRRYFWGMVGSVFAIWFLYVIGLIPLIAEGPNLKTQVAKVRALDRPCGFLNMDDAKFIFYLDKPYQIFNDPTEALHWAIRTDGILVTSTRVPDQSWECVVKGHRWQAFTPPENPPSLNDSRNFR